VRVTREVKDYAEINHTYVGSIVQDEAIRSGEPRAEGTRITVSDLKRRVIDAREDL
jgi:uncharacterized protein (DUF433 family)